MTDKPPRAHHRPISVIVETISALPMEQTLPHEVQMTVNFKFNREKRREMILFLLKEEFVEQPLEFTFVTITGPTP